MAIEDEIKIDTRHYYAIEDIINNVAKHFGLSLPDAHTMTEIEINDAERIICQYVDFVEHEDYIQYVPQDKKTKQLILD